MSTRGAERREQMRSPDIVGDVCEVPVFRPTMEEMRMGFEAYIHKIENQIAIKGLVKIIPPSEWEPRKGGYSDIDDLVRVESPIRQHTTGGRGIFRNLFVTERTTPVSKFRMDVTKPSKRAPARLNGDLFELERCVAYADRFLVVAGRWPDGTLAYCAHPCVKVLLEELDLLPASVWSRYQR
eukprot:scaffold3365_cov358-Prasinococcus_capsulatus_cf.AAC.4